MANLYQSTAPAALAVSLAEVKSQVAQGDDADDTLLTRLISAATEEAERAMGRQLINASWTYQLDTWPAGDVIQLPIAPLSSITSVSYVDTAGTTQTWASTNYTADVRSEPGRLILGYQKSWPTIRDYQNVVTIVFVAGYGASSANVPERIRDRLLKLIAAKYENRGYGPGTQQALEQTILNGFAQEREYGNVQWG